MTMTMPSFRILAALGLLALAHETTFAQGSLTPPGAPGPTMLTLSQIEPRTPITNLPFVIDTPGSYFLTGPHSSTNKGIIVSSSDVTIDLMGFTISGPQNTNIPGIHLAGGNDVMLRNIVVRNGGITRFGTGLLVENIQSGHLRNLIIHQNTGGGVLLRSNSPGLCTDITLENNTVTDNGGTGVEINGNGMSGNNRSHIIRNNTISGNKDYGVNMSYAFGCLVDGNVFGPQVTTTTNAFAIRSGASRNLIIRNFELGSTNGLGTGFFYISGSDTYGPTINHANTLIVTNNDFSPWANFSR